MTPEEFKIKMQEIRDDAAGDIESDHGEADNLMCEVLSSLGYDEGVQIYRRLEKWYS